MREASKAIRSHLTPRQKSRWDRAILRHLIKLPAYQNSHTLLTYASMPDEVDTFALMQDAWQAGKRVAVPYCVPGTRLLEFYLINSPDELTPSAYGIPEPNPAVAQKLTDFSGSVCVVPGLAFNAIGYRVGYGGGYYDRFLSGPYAGNPSIGVCYGVCMVKFLPIGPHDHPCNYVVTETGARVIRLKKTKKFYK
ncbi:MAG TPA: 5-formyltetrahydrofolate cyclo-ligase [Clostridiales bacterium]|nr:5-formyltetrahydrofolate cyclo-ligase [Clostridiales bacterium]